MAAVLRVRPRLWQLWLVLAISAAPLLAALLAYSFDWPGGRANYGAIVDPPRGLPALDLLDSYGRPATLHQSAQPRRWRMLVAAPAACEAACRKNLYYTRQLRTATGEDRDRIARLWIVTDDGQPDRALLAEHPDLIVLRLANDASRAALARWLAGDPDATDIDAAPHLLDPRDELMLTWPAEPDPARMRRDLSRLLKVSRIG
ncbi:hypothetical protein [Derxia lacustris]|uniref:hypothetical protein n=1 Tax=Derxia lacustris TaxID=764842 RepID=UPI000A170D4D|nr:hypothetical protein [Derxia lacustris]